jgi:TPR repeat protein
MPGLVKIGKTRTDPETRADELSGATGVASKFQVVYDAYFSDCSRAESLVHTILERAGLRPAANREFFSASVKEAIKAVAEAERALGSAGDSDYAAPAEPEGEEIGELGEPSASGHEELWNCIMSEALDYEIGTDRMPPNPEKALQLYKKAAKVGAPGSWVNVYHMYLLGEGTREDGREALRWLRDGVEHGDCDSLYYLGNAYAQGDLGLEAGR